jgi:hypothetical protein
MIYPDDGIDDEDAGEFGDRPLDEGQEGFYMDIDAADLAAMDEHDRQADERYRAACERGRE